MKTTLPPRPPNHIAYGRIDDLLKRSDAHLIGIKTARGLFADLAVKRFTNRAALLKAVEISVQSANKAEDYRPDLCWRPLIK